MTKTLRAAAWLTGVAIALSGTAAMAQSGDGPLSRIADWFAPKNLSTPAPSKGSTDPAHRAMEIQIELAWLADPSTFPYFLEARVRGNTLDVRGHVPNKTVAAKAINIARVQCPFAVSDSLKENSSLTVRPVKRSPEQLQAAVQTALREAFPKQHQGMQIECFPGGIVQVEGNVASEEQRLAVSQSLRRLHGCTAINNLTQVGAAEAVPAKRATQAVERPQETANNSAKKPGFLSWFGKATTPDKAPAVTKAPTKSGQPYETRGAVVAAPEGANPVKAATNQTKTPAAVQTASAKNVTPAGNVPATNVPAANSNSKPASKSPLIGANKPAATSAAVQPGAGLPSAGQLKKRLESALPGRNISVNYTAKDSIRIEVIQRPGEDPSVLVSQIFGLRDLDPFGDRVELQFTLPAETSKSEGR